MELLLDFIKASKIECMEHLINQDKLDACFMLESALFEVDKEYLLIEDGENSASNKTSIIEKIFELISNTFRSIIDAFANIFGITESMNEQEYVGANANKQIKFSNNPSKTGNWFRDSITTGENFIRDLISGKPVDENALNEYNNDPNARITKAISVGTSTVLTTLAAAGTAKVLSGDIKKKSESTKELENEVKSYSKNHAKELNENLGDKVEKTLSTVSKMVAKFGEFVKSVGSSVASKCGKMKDASSGKITDSAEIEENRRKKEEANASNLNTFSKILGDDNRKIIERYINKIYTKHKLWDPSMGDEMLNKINIPDNKKRYAVAYAKEFYNSKK